MDKDRVRMLIDAIVKIRGLVDDVQAVEVKGLYPAWKADVQYVAGERVLYNEVLYKVLQDHTSQETWTPTDAPSLFAKILIPDENVIPEWEQPDSTNPYMKGDKVLYKDVVYVSVIDNNTWSPEAYPAGWEVYTE
jgi:hypothetical protein